MDPRVRERADRQRMIVSLDEGGLRCRGAVAAAYVPYEVIADATIANTFFGSTVLVLDIEGEEKPLRITLANGNPFDVLGAVLTHIARPHPSARHSSLRRDREPLAAWLERVRATARGEGSAPYRDGERIDAGTLAATLDDPNAPSDERAAAAHALLEIGDDEAIDAVARVLVTRALPPIVLVATRLARGGTALVGEELGTDVAAFVDPNDADAAASLPLRRDDEIEARIVKALERATREANEAIEKLPVTPRGRRLSDVAFAGHTDATKWIGRSWAF